ncbi:MAG: PhoH family protein [Spirochaetaceae bacterium]
MAAERATKTFVIDTNVFIHRSDAILSFRGVDVVIPVWVLEELDQLKSYSDERGRNARHAIRLIDTIGKHGNLREGAKMENGSRLSVALTHADPVDVGFLNDKMDNRIILSAYQLQQEGREVFFVSKDINARIKATALGIKAVDYDKQKVNADTLYSGYSEINASAEDVQRLVSTGSIPWNATLPPNHFLLLQQQAAEDSVIGRYHADEGSLHLVDYKMPSVAGVRPLNSEQRMAFELLLDPDVNLVTLIGKAGTGKTLLAIAAGLHMTLEEKTYQRVLVSRPVIPMGKDIGYLPGAKNEKLSHWMQPLFDNLEYIIASFKRPNMKTVDQLVAGNVIELEALSYIRGRSLPGQFIVIDEAQNLSPHEIKTIVSRAGEGSKVVLTGDPQQIDSPYLDASSNGLSFLVEAFKGQDLFGHVTLQRSERSRLAELAAELL